MDEIEEELLRKLYQAGKDWTEASEQIKPFYPLVPISESTVKILGPSDINKWEEIFARERDAQDRFLKANKAIWEHRNANRG